jgi:glycosyltransferase involved in cell wall biosynthesis
VIGCSGSGVEEIVTDGANGHLVAPGDVDALTDALGRLLLDDARREAMALRARAYAEAEADTRLCVRRLEGLYETVTAGVRR